MMDGACRLRVDADGAAGRQTVIGAELYGTRDDGTAVKSNLGTSRRPTLATCWRSLVASSRHAVGLDLVVVDAVSVAQW